MTLRPALFTLSLALTIAIATAATAQSKGPRKETQRAKPDVHALLINGGGSAKANYLSHLHHLQDMYEVLVQRGLPHDNITVFTSDGEAKGKDLATRAVASQVRDRWLIGGTPLGKALRPQKSIVNTTWPGGPSLRPATYQSLRKWFKSSRKQIPDGSTLLVFVTDHGTRGKEDLDNGNISLWNESMSVLEFRALLSHLAPDVRVVLLMSQCFSGSFASTMYDLGRSTPNGNVCGFFSTTNDRYAYGCYAEGRGRDQIGHAFQFIDALRDKQSMDDAHHRVLHMDNTPDVPLRSSDVFLDHVIQDNALGSGKDLTPYVDGLIAKALTHAKDYEAELRALDAIAEQFGIGNPRRLSQLNDELDTILSLIEQAENTEKRWDRALDDLRQANLRHFLGSPAGARWKPRVSNKAIKKLKDRARTRLAAKFMPAISSFTHAQPHVMSRLELLRTKANEGSELRYRMQKREAGALRSRVLLIRIAGLEVIRGLHEDDPDRIAAEQLTQCERHVFGAAPKTGRIVKRNNLSELADDLTKLETLSPAWLGIAYRAYVSGKESKDPLGLGAVEVRKVAPESPASDAGLEPGDIVHGAEGASFQSQFELREWVMMAPKNKPLDLMIRRDEKDIVVKISLRPHPLKVSFVPKPTKEGESAPALALKDLDGKDVTLEGQTHLLLYWATWCKPCKKALPEVLDWANSSHATVVMISDEPSTVQREFLSKYTSPVPKLFTSDEARDSFRKHGIRGTPTFILVDATGVIRHRQTGYDDKKGLMIPGWTWKKGKR
jgi:thiol-disulfide isomerase/thioredoxin